MVIFRTEVDLGEGKTKFVTADAGIEPDGSFKPSTFRSQDGLVAGEHTVVVSPLPGGPGGEIPDTPLAIRLSPKYHRAETSGLRVTMTPDTTELVLTVEAETPKKK